MTSAQTIGFGLARAVETQQDDRWTPWRAVTTRPLCLVAQSLQTGGNELLLLEMLDFFDVLRSVEKFEADALAVLTCRKSPPFDQYDFGRHVCVLRVMGEAVDSWFRDDLPRM
jgi:hypothetical protein